MIDIKTLRPGNLVEILSEANPVILPTGILRKVTEIKFRTLTVIDPEIPEHKQPPLSLDVSQIGAIPLGVDELEKMGFKKHGDWMIRESLLHTQINVHIPSWKCTIGHNEEYEIEPQKYYHDMQNLIFSLNREEL